MIKNIGIGNVMLKEHRIVVGIDNKGYLYQGIAGSLASHGYWSELQNAGALPMGTLLEKEISKADYIALCEEQFSGLDKEEKKSLENIKDKVQLFAIVCDSLDFFGTDKYGYQEEAILAGLDAIPGDEPVAVCFAPGNNNFSFETTLKKASKEVILY